METFDNLEMLEPADLYKTRLKDAFHENAIKYFEEMDKKAKVNVDQNQAACTTYYKEQKIADDTNKQLSKTKAGRAVSIVFGIIFAVVGVILIITKNTLFKANTTLGIIVGAICIVIGIGLIILGISLGKKIKNLSSIAEEHQKKADAAKQEASETMAPLNNLFEWNMAANLMSKTTPLIQLDQVFDGKKYQMLNERFGYDENYSTDTSAVYVQSGSILGNPFVFEKNYCQTMGTHRYTGTLTITYTRRVSNGNGGFRTETVTQVLTAYLDKPEPIYYYDTTLIYGNDAAPKLSFSRKPTDINNMNEKQIEKYVNNFDKKLDKMVDKNVSKGGNFTRLANEEFEALFNALDRNNETEFRLLFTPLAQKNMIDLLKDKVNGFGDDFVFRKREKLNYVTSGHMQGSNSLDRSPESLMCFDYKLAKDTFVNYADKYLKDIFFNFAPLLCIPLYQQHKTIEYIYKGQFAHNVTQAEAESAANGHDVNLFKHPATRSAGVILKSRFDRKVDKADLCTITAYSFKGEDRLDYVPVMGGDGKLHNVPVHWIEYLPISKETPFVVTDTEADLSGYRALRDSGKFNDIINKFAGSSDMLYKKRMFSFIPKENN